jgi:hypothetical protein
MKKLLLIALLGSSGLLFSQTLCIGSVEQCREMQKQLCAEEKAPANLELSDSKLVEGTVIDQTGAKFETGVAVQLRSTKSGEIVRNAQVSNGVFSLGQIESGSYRLIFVKTLGAAIKRLVGFDQPKSLVCEVVGSICKLSVMPTVHGSDNPIDYCPPK